MAVKRVCAIDIHHHYVSPMLVEEAKRHGKALGVGTAELPNGLTAISFLGGNSYPLFAEMMGVEHWFQVMERERIAMAAAEAWTSLLGYELIGEHGETWCRIYNEGILDLARRYPERIVGLAAVPMQDPPRAAKVLEHAIRDLKLSGVMIATNANGKYYHLKEFEPFWAKVQELDVLVVMHPEYVAGEERMKPMHLRFACGNPADTTLSLGYILYGGLLDRFPNLKICTFHGGGFFPYNLGRFDRDFTVSKETFGLQCAKTPSAYLQNLYFDTIVYRRETLKFLKTIVGASRLMIGTDYLFELGDWKAVEKVEALDCPDHEKEAILEGNAKCLLKM